MTNNLHQLVKSPNSVHIYNSQTVLKIFHCNAFIKWDLSLRRKRNLKNGEPATNISLTTSRTSPTTIFKMYFKTVQSDDNTASTSRTKLTEDRLLRMTYKWWTTLGCATMIGILLWIPTYRVTWRWVYSFGDCLRACLYEPTLSRRNKSRLMINIISYLLLYHDYYFFKGRLYYTWKPKDVTVVAMEVLIKYCINSFLQVGQFIW